MKNIKKWEDVEIGEIFICNEYTYQKSTNRTAYCFKDRRKFTFRKGELCEIVQAK